MKQPYSQFGFTETNPGSFFFFLVNICGEMNQPYSQLVCFGEMNQAAHFSFFYDVFTKFVIGEIL